jgi:hypothetical protein
MHKHNYVHADLHPGNIGINLINKNTTILINKKDIPTYGYQILLIDYGLVTNKNWLQTKKELKYFNELILEEFKWTINNLCSQTNFFQILEKNNVPFIPVKKVLTKIKTIRPKIYQYWYDILKVHNSNLDDIVLLYHVNNPKEFHTFFLEAFEIPFDKINLKKIWHKNNLPLQDIEFFCTCNWNQKAIFNYIYSKMI